MVLYVMNRRKVISQVSDKLMVAIITGILLVHI